MTSFPQFLENILQATNQSGGLLGGLLPEFDQSKRMFQDQITCSSNCTTNQDQLSLLEYFKLVGGVWFRSNLGLAAFAIFPNVLILEIFRRLGISDSPTSLTLFVLTLSDLTVTLFLFFNTVLGFLPGLETVLGELTAANLKSQSESMLYIMNRMSSLYTVYLTTMKCCCVALPLEFKLLFTQRNVLKHLTMITVACLLTSIPTSLMTYKSWRSITDGNITHSGISSGTDSLFGIVDEDAVRMGIFVFEPSICQIIVIVDLVILTAKLKHTSKIRSASNTKCGESSSSDVRLSGKELRAVKSVMVVAAMFAVCNVPVIIITFASSSLQYFEQFDKDLLDSVFYLGLQVKHSFIACCSFLNIFVYLQYNSSFRQHIMSLVAKLFCKRQRVDSPVKGYNK